MKYFIIILALIFFACKSSENITESIQTGTPNSLQNIWTKIDFKPEKGLLVPNNYTTYQLDQKMFLEQLSAGRVLLPNINDGVDVFEVRDSGTMSKELQNKFPNIRSYAGVRTGNDLCHCRIDRKNDVFKIAVQCNDKTYFIKDLYNLGLYFVYNKKDLPEGVGAIRE